MKKTLSLILTHLLPAVLVANAAFIGLDPEREVSQYARRTWTMRDGMPQGGVQAIAQTPDGYLWLATDQGLARFDGTRFTVYTPATTPVLGAMAVSHLATSSTGTLWIVTESAILTWRNGEFRTKGLPVEFAGLSIRSIAPSQEGRVWFATNLGVFSLGEDTTVQMTYPAALFPEKGPLSIHEMADGTLLVSTAKGVYAGRNGLLRPHDAEALKGEIVTRIAGDAHGIWMLTPGEGVLSLTPDGTVRRYTVKDGLIPGRLYSLALDGSGAAWFGGTGAAINRVYRGKVSSVATREGFRTEGVRALFCDREGNIWAGTSSAILHRYVNGAFVVHAAGKAEAEQMTWVVARDPALGMVIGTESGRLLHWTGDRFRPHPAFPKSFDAAPMSYLRSRSGEIFVGTSNGLHVRRGKGKQFIPLGMVSAMFESKDGVVWIGASKGLWQYCEEGLRPFGEGKFPHVGVRAIQPARGGGLWLGTNGAGLIRLKDVGGRTPEKCDPDYASYTREQGLGSNWVMSVAEDSAGLLWLTTPAGGLTLLRDGTLTLFTPADGLPDQVFFTAAQDGLGYLWCSSNRGITRFRIADLVARADGRIPRVPSTTFGMDDGLVSDECNGGYQGSVALASDGSLWFPTASGAAVVDPRRAGRSADPPPVVIDRLAVDHEELPPGTPAEVGHGKGELEFHYVGLFLGGPERVAYRVRLVGFDPDWVDAGSRQTAYYTNIPPGEYTFRVEARVDDGAWGPAPAEANLTLSPRFTQTGLFALLCLLCIAGAVAGGFALYRRDRERELHSTRLESDLARTRLQVLEMQLQPHFLFNTLNSIMVLIGKDPEIARKTMGRLADILRRSLDRRGTQEVTLAEELEFLNRYVEIERVRFGDRLTVETTVGGGMEQALVPTMILQPLVENAIQHGVSAQRGPARITIAATRGENGNLVIDVEDNGLGLQPTGRAFLRKGIGLTNTQERLRQLYGESQDLRLQNLPGGGMSVRVAIPYHIQSVMA